MKRTAIFNRPNYTRKYWKRFENFLLKKYSQCTRSDVRIQSRMIRDCSGDVMIRQWYVKHGILKS